MAENTHQKDIQITDNLTSSALEKKSQELRQGLEEIKAEGEKATTSYNREIKKLGFTPMEVDNREPATEQNPAETTEPTTTDEKHWQREQIRPKSELIDA